VGSLSIGLALAAAALWGSGDFLGGFANRSTSLLSVLLISQGVGLAGMLIAAVVLGGDPSLDDLVFGAAGGLCGAAGVAMLYRGLAAGTMSLVAPITGVVAVVVPVLVGIGGGERPAALQYAGIVLAVAAVAMLSSGGSAAGRLDRRTVLLALGAGLGFGLFYVALARTSTGAHLWPLVSARAASVAVLSIVSIVARRAPGFGAASPLVIVGAGVFDVTANALYLLAVHGGLLSIIAVLVSLYPVSTVLCSMVFLGERLRPPQVAGVAVALAAVICVTAG
jgi:drug/metabolite transporter (DMT)-like permease